MVPCSVVEIVNRKRYATDNATLLAGNDYWDGHNYERQGRNSFLYGTSKGAYFIVSMSQWEGEGTSLEPVDIGEAMEAFESMREKRVEYENAFPNIKIEDA